MKKSKRDVYIVDGTRTPFIKIPGKPNPLSASDLAVAAGGPLLARQQFKPSDLDEVILGCVIPSASEANIARIVALRLQCGHLVPAWTVQRNCASGMQAVDSAFKDIACGRCDLVLAGGTEAMSRAPLLFDDAMAMWLAKFSRAKTFMKKLTALKTFRLKYLVPQLALLKGLFDPVVALSMGQTAEKVAYQFNITREQMDEFALQSHVRAAAAYENNCFSEIVPLFDWQGGVIEQDNGLRPDSDIYQMAKLRAVFDKPFGQVTAGNSSQVTDGAAMLILASKEAVDKHHLRPIAKISDIHWAALDPAVMGLGPVHAIDGILKNQDLQLNDIDYWEINEAFAAQVLGCLRALESTEYCQTHLGRQQAYGSIDMAKLNIDGGAISIGHPVGASGARLVLHLAHTLQRTRTSKGIASLCIGGGQGGAVLVEAV